MARAGMGSAEKMQRAKGRVWMGGLEVEAGGDVGGVHSKGRGWLPHGYGGKERQRRKAEARVRVVNYFF
jgi:hypothetical protein